MIRLVVNKALFAEGLFGEDAQRARSRRGIALPVGVVLVCLPLGANAQGEAGQGAGGGGVRPNVLIIYADDLGVGDLSCYGARGIATPHIDALARGGIRFDRAYSAAATSTPSRYALLTGQYAWRRAGTGVATGDAGMIIPPDQFTLADLFHKAGYRTGVVGKWHLGLGDRTGGQDWNGRLTLSPRDLGFDYSFVMAATGDRVPCVFIEGDSVSGRDPSAPIEVSYREPFEGEPTGRSHPELLHKLRSSHGHADAIVNGIGRIGYMKGGGTALWRDEDIADSITSRAIRFVEESHREGRPFFLYFAPNDVHVPRYPHERFRGKSPLGLRGEAILQLDWSVGQIVEALRSRGLLDETLILFSSDNGAILDDGYEDGAVELLGDHRPSGDLRGYKYGSFEGGCRVPTILHWGAGAKGGATSDALVSQVDLLASFADLLGVRLGQGVAPDSWGQMPAWLGRDADGRPWVIEQAGADILSVCTSEWKLIEASDAPPRIPWLQTVESGASPRPQLYHIASDPEETKDLALERPDVVYDLQSILRRTRSGKLK